MSPKTKNYTREDKKEEHFAFPVPWILFIIISFDKNKTSRLEYAFQAIIINSENYIWQHINTTNSNGKVERSPVAELKKERSVCKRKGTFKSRMGYSLCITTYYKA